MPRPPLKRRKPNHSPPGRVGRFDSKTARAELERKLANKPIGQRPQDSDDSDGLVTKSSSARSRQLTPRQEIYASGAVGKGDKPGAWPTRSQRTRSMREDTAEILRQRSKSLSRANSEVSNERTPVGSPPKLHKDNVRDNGHFSDLTHPQGISTAQSTKQVSRTPSGETSVLGKIKPRKRQHSILQLIDNDESAIHTGDEEEFLPDEVSTPVELNPIRALKQPDQARVPSVSASKKRKREAQISEHGLFDPRMLKVRDSLDSLNPGLSLPTPSRTQSKLLLQRKTIEDDILALPESSPESSPQKTKSPVVQRKTKSQTQTAPSTQQLQLLMPSRRHTSIRPRRQLKDKFDISEDSTSDPLEDRNVSQEYEEEHSAFLPAKASKLRSRRAAVPIKPKKVPGVPKKKEAKSIAQSSILKSKSNKSTKASKSNVTSTPSPKGLRKPLPLSSAKSRVQLQDKTNTTSAPTPAKPAEVSKGDRKQLQSDLSTGKQQYGGSLTRYGRVTRGQAAGKENDPFSVIDKAPAPEADDIIVETIEYDHSSPMKSLNKNQLRSVSTMPQQGSDMVAWQNKWGDIDEYSLDFEEITPASLDDSTRSSQRDMR